MSLPSRVLRGGLPSDVLHGGLPSRRAQVRFCFSNLRVFACPRRLPSRRAQVRFCFSNLRVFACPRRPPSRRAQVRYCFSNLRVFEARVIFAGGSEGVLPGGLLCKTWFIPIDSSPKRTPSKTPNRRPIRPQPMVGPAWFLILFTTYHQVNQVG